MISIDDTSNITGMSYLINTQGKTNSFNTDDLESQIINGPKVENKNATQDLESEIDKIINLSDKDFSPVTFNATTPFESGSISIDNILKMIDAPESQTHPQPQNSNRNPDKFIDKKLEFMTNEEMRQGVIKNVFNDIEDEQGDNPIFSIEKEKEEDEKSRKLEQISFLRDTMSEESEDLSRVPNVTQNNSINEIDAVLKLLTLKNDRKRCCTFAEDCILLGAHGVEWVFDGNKKYFGYKPDMIDWHKSVQTKLRRMRHDTSNVVSGIMTHYNLGSATRIVLELLPSMLLYSRMRKSQHNDTITEDEFNAGLNSLRDFEVK